MFMLFFNSQKVEAKHEDSDYNDALRLQNETERASRGGQSLTNV